LKYLKAAINGNEVYAMYYLGCYYLERPGLEKDYKKALRYLNKGADLKNGESINKLGECYLNGWGVVQDKTMAFNLFNNAADLENKDAFVNIGNCFFQRRRNKRRLQQGC
jgi:TPR repeat protein